jgi:hypothetical protein
MKSKYQTLPQTSTSEKPAKAHISDAEFRRRLKNIEEWRKKRLGKPHTKNTSGNLRTPPL